MLAPQFKDLPTVLHHFNDHLTRHFGHPSQFTCSAEAWDLSSRSALALAKILGKSPQALALEAVKLFHDHPWVAQAQAINGYINLTLHAFLWHGLLRDLLIHQETYGLHGDNGKCALIEYVSANPTGPLHAAHGRGAILGDVMANMLQACGWHVKRAYLINDAGVQVETLGRSVLCHLESLATHQPVVLGRECYPAPYVRELAQEMIEESDTQWRTWTHDQIAQKSISKLMAEIQRQMDQIGVAHTVFTSEKKLQKTAFFAQMMAALQAQEVVTWQKLEKPLGHDGENWKPEPVLVLTHHEEVIGVLGRRDGTWTYFASDIVYHASKAQECDLMITILGADHSSHIHKLKTALKEVLKEKTPFEILDYQLVQFYDNHGKIMKMSKRAGTFLTLEHVLSLMDADSLRFMMLTKNPKTPLDISMGLLEKQNKENPSFYVQYAHARCCSVLRAAQIFFKDIFPKDLSQIDLSPLKDFDLIKKLVQWPTQLSQATEAREPHRITAYLYDVAHNFHCLWQKGTQNPTQRFLQDQNIQLSQAYLALVQATAVVLKIGLSILGIKAKEEMH